MTTQNPPRRTLRLTPWQIDAVVHLRSPRTWEQLRAWSKASGVVFSELQTWINNEIKARRCVLVRDGWSLRVSLVTIPKTVLTQTGWRQISLF